MSTIFEPLSESITNQIKIRQDIMANKVTNPTVRNAYLNRACKVRLVPLVKDTKGDTDYNDFVFGNFTLEDNFFNSLGFKFSDKAEKPYINNFEIVTRSGDNYGATRTGKISIVVPTKKQFNLIERYFRIGVPFLLEWGWAEHVKYEGNNPTKETTEFIDPKLYEGDKINGTELEEAVFDNKEAQNGNYDGGLFFITNFTTNIQNSGVDYYYVLDINMVTKGDILNNLKQNKTTDPNTSTSANIENRIDSDPLIRFLRRLNQEGIENIQRDLETTSFNPETNEVFIGTIVNEEDSDSSLAFDFDLRSNYIRFDIVEKNLLTYNTYGSYFSGDPRSKPLETTVDSYSYIKLGYFLNLLSFLDIDGNLTYVNDEFEYRLPLYYYNLPEYSNNYYSWIWIPEEHFASINPRKFILPHYKWGEFFGEEFISREDNKKIKNILLETAFLIDEISNLIRKDEYSINNILTLILNTINRYTDNDIRLIKYDINDFEYSIVSIVDGDDLNTDNLLTLKLYGTGSIVEETNIDTVINDSISSQVAIMMNGSSDYVTDSQAISLLKFNNGIKSRIKSELPDKGDGRVNLQSILETISTELIEYHSILTSNPNKDGPQYDTLKLYKRFKQEYIAATIEYNQFDNIKGTPLFPIKIKTRLPGVSGIKIGNKLKVDDVRLPDIYTDRNIYYVVTNYNSTINNRYWESHIDLSPQINTQVTQLSQSEYDSKSGLIQEADIEKVLDTIKAIYTDRYWFRGGGNLGKELPQQGPSYLLQNNPNLITVDNTDYSNNPLYIRRPDAPIGIIEGLTGDGRTRAIDRFFNRDDSVSGRGPYQLTPTQYYEVTKTPTQWVEEKDGILVWTNPNNNFLNNNTKPVDTIEESREIARTYIVDLKNKIPSIERTYLRLLSIYYWEQDALDLNILKQYSDNKKYKDFLKTGQQVLINSGVDRLKLHRPTSL
jgi:ACT domain-containing protein